MNRHAIIALGAFFIYMNSANAHLPSDEKLIAGCEAFAEACEKHFPYMRGLSGELWRLGMGYDSVRPNTRKADLDRIRKSPQYRAAFERESASTREMAKNDLPGLEAKCHDLREQVWRNR